MGCKIFSVIGLFILIGIILIGSISAGSCSDDQRIMRLFQATNSHGALWDTLDSIGEIYDVCFDEIFGYAYVGTNVHSCHTDGKNKLINLYQTYNSHGQVPSVGTYTKEVCFGDLDCRTVTNSADCAGQGENITISLYQITNSHISFGDDLNNQYKICCKAFNVDSVNWADMVDKPISNTYLNDRVKLMVSGAGFKDKNFIFTVKKINLLGDTDVYGPVIINGQSNNYAYATWRANAEGRYYYTVTTYDGATYNSKDNPASNPFGILTVSNIELNSAPVANITNPKKGEVYFKGVNINFNQLSYDIDDFINYSWNFIEDLSTEKGSTRDYVNYNLTYNYNSAGQKNINLSVIDERGLTDHDWVSIIVIDPTAPVGTKYVFAGISKPKYKQIISMIGNIKFEALDSYALEITSTSPISVKCLGGKCPDSIPGVLPANYDKTQNNDFSVFNFSWRFDDGSESGKISGNPIYSKGFSIGYHFAKLEVSLDTGEESDTFVIFKYTGSGSSECQNDGTLWVDTFTGMSYDTSLANGKCLGIDGFPETSDDCCPRDGHTCQGTVLDAKCTLSADCIPIPPCSNYTTEPNCIADKCGSAQKYCTSSSSSGTICAGVDSSGGTIGGACNCFWNDSAAEGKKCQQNIPISINIGDINLIGTGIIDSYTQGECIEGLMAVTQHCTKTWENSIDDLIGINIIPGVTIANRDEAVEWANNNCEISNCFSGTRMMVCDDNGIRLGFFNWFNTLIAVILIAIIYFVLNSFKKIKNKKVKRKRK